MSYKKSFSDIDLWFWEDNPMSIQSVMVMVSSRLKHVKDCGRGNLCKHTSQFKFALDVTKSLSTARTEQMFFDSMKCLRRTLFSLSALFGLLLCLRTNSGTEKTSRCQFLITPFWIFYELLQWLFRGSVPLWIAQHPWVLQFHHDYKGS